MDRLNGQDYAANSPANAQESAADIVSKMALAHEILMDDSFKLQSELPENSLEKQVRDVVHKAFWDKLREELNQEPPVFTQALSLLGEVKENMLLLLLPHHNSLRGQINDVLDLELIQQQAHHQTLDISKLGQFVVGILSKLCAPARDKQVKKILEKQDIVDLFRDVFSLMDVMKVDMANFHLQAIRPQLLQQSIEYERNKFKEYLAANPAGLTSTKVWLKRGAEVATGQGSRSAAAVSTEANTTEFTQKLQDVQLIDVLVHGYLGIVLGSPGWPFPETLIMDEFRLAEMRWSVRRTTLIASVLLVTLNSVGRPLAADAAYLANLKEVLYILLDGVPEGGFPAVLPGVYEQIVSETDKMLEMRGFSKLTSHQRDLLKGQIEGIASSDNTVLNLLTWRAYDFMFAAIKGNIQQRKADSAGQAVPAMPQGLTSVSTELSEMTGRFSRVVAHNMAVFAPFYDDILVDMKNT